MKSVQAMPIRDFRGGANFPYIFLYCQISPSQLFGTGMNSRLFGVKCPVPGDLARHGYESKLGDPPNSCPNDQLKSRSCGV